MRVVSLVPSATETLLAWGIVPVAVSRFCEQPAIPAVGGTKDPDVEAITALAPDVVVMCDQENRREDAEAFTSRGICVHAVHITDIDHVGPEMARLASAVGARGAAAAPRLPSASTDRIRAWIPIWKRPWMTVNGRTYASTLLHRIGVANVAAHHPEPYPTIELDDVRALRPDLVLAPSEPYPFGERHRALLETVAPVVFVDGKDLFWWGTRTVDALERLAPLVG